MIRADCKDKETLVTFWCDCGKIESINIKEVLRKKFVREAIEKHAEHTHAEGYTNKYCHWCKLLLELGLNGEQK